tara:strand:+ start:328 stop:1245 length:918 start_codon:yes stop_codon:yes gene_type:complete
MFMYFNMVKSVKIKSLGIKVPKGSAFAYDTPTDCPKSHQMCGVIGKRGSGKSVSAVNLIEAMNYQRVIAVSPSMGSNFEIMKRLNIDPEDIFSDVDDITIPEKIKAIVEQERDDLVNYREQMKKYKKFKKLMDENRPTWSIPDDVLLQFYDPHKGDFIPPYHKYGGQKPMIAVLFDDIQGSYLMTKGARRISQLAIYQRHIGEFPDGGALGCSLFFCVQSFKCSVGGLTRAIRGQMTSMILFKTKNEKELDDIKDEFSGEVSKDTFQEIYNKAIIDPHDFLFIDLHKKPHQPSMFRRNFNEYLVV